MENFSATGRGLASAEAVFAQSFKFFGLVCTFGHVRKVYHKQLILDDCGQLV